MIAEESPKDVYEQVAAKLKESNSSQISRSEDVKKNEPLAH